MYGVVLWSDLTQNKAVFCCDDQGDLAFYHACPETSLTLQLDAGDLVQFDISQDAKLRMALNPRLVHENVAADLPERLIAEQTTQDSAIVGAQVVPFPVSQPDRNGPRRADKS